MCANQSRRIGGVIRNSIIMIVRMFVLMLITFFSSRLLLETLGVEDYGIYSIVGSVATTFVALKSLFSESVQRFLNFYKGKGDLRTQQSVFSLALIIHIVLAVLFVIILELFGLWLINNKLVYPIEKYETVLFVFQMTVVSSGLSILCIPLDAVIIANERMGFFAILSVLDGILRLLMVLILPLLPYSALKAYSLMIVFIPLSSLIISWLYSRRFEECLVYKSFRINLFREIISLSGWNFFGNISFSILHEGINFVLNIYGGLVYNAARSIAYQVKNVSVQFSSNTLIAVRPMVMQSAADDEGYKTLFKNIIEISRLSFMIMLIPIAPLEAFCPELLNIWLVEVPENTVVFTRLVLLAVLFRSFHEPFNMLYMSVGRIRRMIISESIVMLSVFFCIYIMLSKGYPMWIAFLIMTIMEILIIITLFVNAIKEINFPGKTFLKEVVCPLSCLFFLNEIIVFLFSRIHPQTIICTLFISVFVTFCVLGLIVLFFNKKEKEIINNLFFSRIKLRIHKNICR